ncbi:MAG: hypothetical protein HBSAPP03_27430 [Phycisphaerae bacterium]|nr:MAG: hypothetical protein HBSAPP03_27430 [Phycisphaerae bacterium]
MTDNIASGDPINITDIDNTWTAIRVRSTSSTNPASIGRITLTTGEPRNAPFEVLVTGDYCRIEFPILQPSNAGTTWSGLTFGENSDSLRNNTRLVAAISGNLTGSVACGSVYRLQLGGDVQPPACDPDVNCDGAANGIDVEIIEAVV